jgi:hypothetical protein
MAGDPEKYRFSHDDNDALLAYRYRANPTPPPPQPPDKELKRRKRPIITLAALCMLLLSSGIGLTITVLLMLRPLESKSACVSRDVIFASALLSLLYTGMHIRAAMNDYRRNDPGPPNLREN